MKKKILVVDIGGSNVKLMISRDEKRKFDSGHGAHARKHAHADGSRRSKIGSYDAVSIGFPSVVRDGEIMKEPKQSRRCAGLGWDCSNSLGKPIARHQRRGHAGARQLSRRAHAVPRARHRTWLDA